MSERDLPAHVAHNRAYWDRISARYVEPGERAWASDEVSWGIFQVPERELGVLPAELRGKDVVELGCGTAYVSAWLARRGANVVGIDNSAAQLATARRLQAEHGLAFPLVHGNAEATGLPAASFDLVISEYGVSIWADPYQWIGEAARLLRSGGELTFLTNGTLWVLTVPETDHDGPAGRELRRPYFGMHRFAWDGLGGVEFFLTYGDWIRLLRRHGFEVLDLIEIQAPVGAPAIGLVDPAWARDYPAEQIWKARKQ